MKKNLTKVALLVALTAPVCMNLASCTKPEPSKDKYDCVEEAKKASKEGRKLTILNFWHAFNNVNETAARIINDRFNDEHIKPADGSAGICVTMTSYGDYDKLQDQITAGIQSKKVPDLISSYPDHIANYFKQNVVVDMEKFQSDETLKITDFEDFFTSYQKESYNYVFDKETYDKYNQEVSEGAEYGHGSLMSLPVNKSTEVMYYNKTFFDIFTTGDLTKAKLKSGETADKAKYASQFTPTEITVKYNNKTYTGYPWDLKASDGSKIALKHPGTIDVSKPDTWMTWDDVEVNGLIIQQITLNYKDVITGEWYNDKIQPGDQHESQIQNNGSFSISWDSTSNLFITIANSYDKYSTVKPTGNGSKMKAELLFNDPEVVTTYDKLRDLYKKGIFVIPKLIGDKSSKYGTPAFVGQSIFMSIGSTAGAALNNGGDFEMGVTAPVVVDNSTTYNEDGSVKTTKAKVISQGTNISMLATPGLADVTKDDTDAARKAAYEKQVSAWTYVKYVTDYEQNLTFATNTSYFPTRASVLNSADFKKYMEEKKADPSSASEAMAIEVGLQISDTKAYFTDRPFPESAQLRLDIDPIVTNILAAQDPVSTVVNNFHSEQTKKLSEF